METNCTDTDMMMVLNRSLILTPYPDIGLASNKVCTIHYISELCIYSCVNAVQ